MDKFDIEEMKEWYATKRRAYITDTITLIVLLLVGFHYSLFNWGGDWWYSLLTISSVIFIGQIQRWTPIKNKGNKQELKKAG